jgi:hypothetical protein
MKPHAPILRKSAAHVASVAFLSFLLMVGNVSAHKSSDSYLTLCNKAGLVSGEWHLALRDLDPAIGLDLDDDGLITWKELRSRQAAVIAYAVPRLTVQDSDGHGTIRVTQLLVDNHSDGAYAVVRFVVDGAAAESELTVEYRAFFEIDPSHRGLLRLEGSDGTRLAVFSPETSRQQFHAHQRAPGRSFLLFVKEGIWHIWTGYDHMLFLIALLLPGVLRRRAAQWEPEKQVHVVLREVLKTVTAFTVAHSITLSLAALGVARLPVRFIECAIAASVVVAALNNLWPLIRLRGWAVAFAFGLIHGFGFANALADLGLNRQAMAGALVGFNGGVELGQLAIVAGSLPVAIMLRERPFYRSRCLPLGSTGIAVVAAAWFVQRAFDWRFLSL